MLQDNDRLWLRVAEDHGVDAESVARQVQEQKHCGHDEQRTRRADLVMLTSMKHKWQMRTA